MTAQYLYWKGCRSDPEKTSRPTNSHPSHWNSVPQQQIKVLASLTELQPQFHDFGRPVWIITQKITTPSGISGILSLHEHHQQITAVGQIWHFTHLQKLLCYLQPLPKEVSWKTKQNRIASESVKKKLQWLVTVPSLNMVAYILNISPEYWILLQHLLPFSATRMTPCRSKMKKKKNKNLWIHC